MADALVSIPAGQSILLARMPSFTGFTAGLCRVLGALGWEAGLQVGFVWGVTCKV